MFVSLKFCQTFGSHVIMLCMSNGHRCFNIMFEVLGKLTIGDNREFPPFDNVADEQQYTVIETLLGDGKPRTSRQLAAETGMANIPARLLRRLSRLPDMRYTLPDSEGAGVFFWSYLHEKPRPLRSVMRQLRDHKNIKASILSALENQDRLVKLPRGLITTCDSPAGRQTLEKRRDIQLCEDILLNLPVPFFTLEEAGVSRIVPGHIIDRYAVTISFNNKEMLCLRREFPGKIIQEQIYLMTAKVLKTRKKISTPVFIKNNTVGVKEALNLLNTNDQNLLQIVKNNGIDTIKLDGKPRFWRADIERIKKYPNKLKETAKNHTRYDIPHTAVILGLSTGQVKRLISEGHLSSATQHREEATNSRTFTGEDIAILQHKLPEILYKWRSLRNKGRIPAHNTEKKPLLLRQRIVKTELPEEKPSRLQLDDFQIKAIEALRTNQSVLLSAPTGNGKTLVAEILARDLMGMGKGLVYTSPLKALSNQKYRDFKDIFGEEQVGLVTGDVNVNPGAPLLIMTTEIFRNWCIGEQELLANTVYVIFDEFHYLDDNDRGTTWEESILFAPNHIKFLGLSATVPNIEEIADWVGAVRGERVVIIEEKTRQVPLNICWLSAAGQIINRQQAQLEVKELVDYQKAYRNRKHWAED